MNSSSNLGCLGEHFVAQYLEERGYKILAKNHRSYYGEIDIIAQQEDLIVFVEVKTRVKSYFPIADVVTMKKQRKIIVTAKRFLLKNKMHDKMVRFDVATVLCRGTKYQIDYFTNAFEEVTF